MWSTFLTGGAMDVNRESGFGSESDTLAELAALLQTELPEGRNSLAESHTNLERVAEYCEGNYFQSENKRYALEETKNYTTQSLASVAYQINTLAFNFLQLLDLQTAQLAEMESQMNHIAQTVMIHKEKVARREIGVLTANKSTARQYKIIAPANPEKPIKYVRKPIDYTALDLVGHGVRVGMRAAGSKQRGSSQGSIPSMGIPGGAPLMAAAAVGPPPTSKPPTPPQALRQQQQQQQTSGSGTGSGGSTGGSGGTGTLSKGSREYRTPPVVAPPQVPSHYAPNYPLGHPRRVERGAGYSSLPVGSQAHPTAHCQTLPHPHPHSALHLSAHPAAAQQAPPSSPPSVGMVHPIAHHHHTLHRGLQGGAVEHLASTMTGHTLPHHSHLLHHSQLMHLGAGSASPPLPPPPDDDNGGFGRHAMPLVPDEHLPTWVPKNYIEKVVAIYDYYADKEDELSFQESSVIYVVKKNDDGWWEGIMDGITGLFPGNYVEPCV